MEFHGTESNSEQHQDRKKILTLVVLIMVVMITTTGATYAYFAIGATNSNVVAGSAGTASLNLVVSKIKPTTTGSGKLVPQYSAFSGNNTLKSAIDKNCIDANNNQVCHVYTIVVTNTGTSAVNLNGTFTLTAANMTNLKWQILAAGTGATPSTIYTYPTSLTAAYGNAKTATYLGAANTSGATATPILLAANGSYYYVVAVWIEETGNSQTDSGNYSGVINFNSSVGNGVTSTIRS